MQQNGSLGLGGFFVEIAGQLGLCLEVPVGDVDHKVRHMSHKDVGEALDDRHFTSFHKLGYWRQLYLIPDSSKKVSDYTDFEF